LLLFIVITRESVHHLHGNNSSDVLAVVRDNRRLVAKCRLIPDLSKMLPQVSTFDAVEALNVEFVKTFRHSEEILQHYKHLNNLHVENLLKHL